MLRATNNTRNSRNWIRLKCWSYRNGTRSNHICQMSQVRFKFSKLCCALCEYIYYKRHCHELSILYGFELETEYCHLSCHGCRLGMPTAYSSNRSNVKNLILLSSFILNCLSMQNWKRSCSSMHVIIVWKRPKYAWILITQHERIVQNFSANVMYSDRMLWAKWKLCKWTLRCVPATFKIPISKYISVAGSLHRCRISPTKAIVLYCAN